MKTCIILTNSNASPRSLYNSQEIGLAKALIALGISVDIFTYSKKHGYNIRSSIIENKNGNEIRLFEYDGFSLPGRQAFSLALLKYLYRNKANYKVVQLYDSTQIMTVFCALICKHIKLPCLLYQGMYRDFDARWKTLLQKLYDVSLMRIFFSSLSAVIGKTDVALEYLRNKGLPARLPTMVIPVGLDITVFNQENCHVRDIPTDVTYDILYVGKLEKRRKSDFLAELFLKLCNTRRNITICVVGNGLEQNSFLKRSKGLIDTGQLTYLPVVENKDLSDIYQRSKIVLNPTTYEIFGMVILEAMYFGTPVIASAEAGPKTIIHDGIDGVLLQGFNLDIWENSIIELLEKETTRRQMSEKAKSKIRNQLVWECIAPKFKMAYDDISR